MSFDRSPWRRRDPATWKIRNSPNAIIALYRDIPVADAVIEECERRDLLWRNADGVTDQSSRMPMCLLKVQESPLRISAGLKIPAPSSEIDSVTRCDN